VLAVFRAPPWEVAAKRAGDGPTWPADAPREEIDFVVLKGGRIEAGVRVIEEKDASDHRPLHCEWSPAP
jgi:endonuclease/exonuclease/phosphatase family metal-dependent hydrolase